MTENYIVVPVRNNLFLTRRAIETFKRQDIPGGVEILVIDNDSTDGTTQWLQTQHDVWREWHRPPRSVAASWNGALRFILDDLGEDYALVVNNDVELRPDTYRWLVADGGGFVTAVGTRDPAKIEPVNPQDGPTIPRQYLPPDPAKKRPHPHFSCFLIRREVWRKVGPFDENFKIAFCEDWDYHLRMHQAGFRAEALELPFLHHGSQTVKNADDAERDRIVAQAELNREYFFQKWGVRGGTPEYYALFGVPPEPVREDL